MQKPISTEELVERIKKQREEAQKYQDQFLIFIDILGFAEFISRSDTDPELTARIYDAITSATSSSPIHGPPAYPKGLSYSPHVITNFSDSIVISAARNGEGLMTVLELGRAFACILLQCGLLTRGGVAGGRLIHEKGLIFGPALVTAYYLESKSAKFARIILHPDCVSLIEAEKLKGARTAEYFDKTLRKDADGTYFLHVLRELEEDAAGNQMDDLHQQWWGEAKNTVQEYLQSSKGKPYRDKCEWFARYYNECVDVSGNERSLPAWRQQIEID